VLNTDTLLYQRFQNKRPGLELMAIDDAALPVTLVGTDVLAQERKPLPLLHEFVLHLADAGVVDTGEIANFLGIDTILVESAIAEQVSADNLSYRSGSATVRLTTRGKNSVRDLQSIQPVHVQMSVAFDRLTWSVADYGRRQLIAKRDAQDAGMLILPPVKTARITIDEVTPVGINKLLRKREGRELRREILAVQRIRPHTHRYLPVKLLVYGDPTRGEVELALIIEGDGSAQHDSVLVELGGAETLGIRVAVPQERPRLPVELEAIRVPETDVLQLRSATIDGRLAAADVEAAAIADANPTSNEELSLANITVRSVSVFEHRELLIEALERAESRLLIISPWVKSAVVDTTFLERLARRLEKGVRVSIAHGIGADDRGSDTKALERLSNLAERYKNFAFSRLANTHAKVLIFDDRWISTSFNWLSFRGDPERTYRMEEGTLVRIPGHVTAQYERYLSLIQEQRVDA
jgi:hypothetical protein